MNACIDVATLLGYAAAGLLGLLVLGLLGALIYLARRLRISISLADGGGAGVKSAVADGVGAGASAGGAVGGVRKRVKAKKPAAASGASRLEILIGILLIGVAAVAVGLLIGIVI